MNENEANKSDELIKIKIAHLIKFAQNFQGIEVHVLISGKFVKMNYGSEQFVDILKKLQEKKLEEVYINQVDCKRIMAEIQQIVSSKTSTDQSKMQSSENSMEILKAFLPSINFSPMIGVENRTVPPFDSVSCHMIFIVERRAGSPLVRIAGASPHRAATE